MKKSIVGEEIGLIVVLVVIIFLNLFQIVNMFVKKAEICFDFLTSREINRWLKLV